MARSVFSGSFTNKCMTISLTLNLFLDIVIGQSVGAEYSVLEVLAGKTCPDVMFTIDPTSAVQCVATCRLHTDCESVFYDRGAKICTGCYVIYNGGGVTSYWPDDAETEYFAPYVPYGETCSATDKPCTENNNVCFPGLGTCVCSPFTNYDPNTGSCVQGCSSWGNTFQRYPGWLMNGHDIPSSGVYIYGINDINTCLQYCAMLLNCFVIKHYRDAMKCLYVSAYPWVAPYDWVADADFDAYVRNCA